MKKLKERILNISEVKLGQWVGFSFLVVLLYLVAEFIVSTITGITHDTLTTCVFAFFGTEICSCGCIKIFKLKNENM